MRIKKGDNVIVIAGKDRGKSGTVTRALPKKDAVIIEGLNMKKKHQRPRRQNQKGQIVEKAMPIHVSNVQVVDPKSGKPSRIGYDIIDGKKVRIFKKSGTVLAS